MEPYSRIRKDQQEQVLQVYEGLDVNERIRANLIDRRWDVIEALDEGVFFAAKIPMIKSNHAK